MKLKVLIADDEPLAREIIVSYLEDFEEVGAITEVANGVEAVKTINLHAPDLLFLDIEMPKMNGISVLDSGQLEHQPLVIFTTAYNQYAIKAFELNAIDYLLKPFDRVRFHDTMKKALEKLRLAQLDDFRMELSKFQMDYANSILEKESGHFPTKLVVKDSKKIKHIQIEDIHVVAAAGDYVEIHENQGKFLLYKSISEIQKKLHPKYFRRIHKSAIINIDKIAEIRPHTNSEFYFHMHNGQVVKSGRTYKDQINDLTTGNI
ncbi:two component transcriptional regulator, LytTR family [Reichenbachiella faecimaris]|uniref:Two component transcriptional regulator, LytTR family n=1 Tax=Reichenbachiella faecimaris TaxID=692418 RepID=A0A1W2G6K8_REIFA|nr:LytTR family DNA-binding domain-containing protein [Reichenbachiella faecimaris]SMD31978.1 two component transcriptional regulator, LytTR family [Reichenbachiella faecimaris]